MAQYTLTSCYYPKGQTRLFVLVLLLCISSALKAQDRDDDNDGIPDTYEKGLGDLTFSSAFQIGGSDNSARELIHNEVQLTQDDRSLRGSAMSFGKIDLNDNFTFTIQAYFGTHRDQALFSSSGADGIAIVFHNDPAGSDAIGNDGEGIGAQGIQHGIVLEIDTYGNGDTGANDPMRGEDDNHTDIWESDDPERVSLIGGYRSYDNNGDLYLEDGAYHDIVFTWVSTTGTLRFTVDGQPGGELSLGSMQSFSDAYFDGAQAVHFGFTASTGAARNEHRVRIVDMANLPVVMDTDGDGIYDHQDLDSDNDGIYDAEEAGHGASHTEGVVDGGDANGDGIPDAVQTGDDLAYTPVDTDRDGVNDAQDTDADGDGCPDTLEMLLNDGDGDGILGTGPAVVDASGLVISAAGYIFNGTAYQDPDIDVCGVSIDLGDAGDGDDAYTLYFEDDPATDLLIDPVVANGEGASFILTIEVDSVRNGDDEKLLWGNLEIALGSDLTNAFDTTISGTNIRLTYIDEVLKIRPADTDGLLSAEMIESILDGLSYVHEDLLTPTGGNRRLKVSITDGTHTSPVNTVTIDVAPVNDLPFADDDTTTLDQGATVVIALIDGDSDPDGSLDLAGIVLLSVPDHGTVTLGSDGTATYDHDGGDALTDSFVYTIRDQDGGVSNEATVTITIVPTQVDNQAPSALPDSVSTPMGQSIQIGASAGLLSNDADPDDDPLTVVAFTADGVTYPVGEAVAFEWGSLLISPDGGYAFAPADGFAGEVPKISYVVSDGDLEATAVLSILVTTVNGAPDANDGSIEVASLAGVHSSLTPLVSDPDGDPLTFEILTTSISDWPGTFTFSADGSYHFIPEPGYVGVITFTYQVCDNGQPVLCDQADISLNVQEMDSDGDGLMDHEEDGNEDGDLSNDDCNANSIPDYLDAATCDPEREIEIGGEALITSQIITNNGDLLNDKFEIVGIENYPNNRVIIFNRWGNKVWEIRGYSPDNLTRCFTGFSNLEGGGVPTRLPDGTYYFIIDKGDQTACKRGFLMLKNQ